MGIPSKLKFIFFSESEKCRNSPDQMIEKENSNFRDKKSWKTPLYSEAFAIGNKYHKNHGASSNVIALKPPGPCPRCKDYRYWHFAKDCHASKCRRCNRYGHKSSKCPKKKNKNVTTQEFYFEPLTWKI